VRYGGSPWSLRDGRRLEPGTSGGITVVGTAAGILAAVACGLLAAVVGVAPLGATAVRAAPGWRRTPCWVPAGKRGFPAAAAAARGRSRAARVGLWGGAAREFDG